MTMQTFTFRRRSTNHPHDMERSFQASGFLEALQQASDYWFGGDQVFDWQKDRNNVVTLLNSSSNGNVIGTLMDCN
jgi:hypothetical protein